MASRDPDRARAFGRALGAKDCFGSYERGDPLALPGAGDRRAAADARRPHRGGRSAAGKHLLIEKPVLARFDELERLWPRSSGASPTVMVAENLHYAPFHRRLKALLASRALGRPLILDLVRLGRSRPTGWRADPAEMPLGALHEGGVHWIRRLLDLAAVFEPNGADRISTSSPRAPRARSPPTPGEDTMMITARHRSGLTSRLLHTWAVPWRFLPFDSSKVLLEHGALYFDARSLYGRAYGPRASAGSGRAFATPPAIRRCGAIFWARSSRAAPPS